MLDLSVRDNVAYLSLNRPSVLNAINLAMADAFRLRIEELALRSDVHVVVTRGEGRDFCAGSDLRELGSLSVADAVKHELAIAEVFSGFDRLPQPTIAMLHGYVLGGGLGLALYHDFRIASEEASLGMPEVELGWTPPWAVGRLAETVGFAKARWLLMACVRLSGREAAAMNVVHEAVPEERLLSRVAKLSETLSTMPAGGLKRTKALLNKMSALRQPEWDALASEQFRCCFESPEAQRRAKNFFAKKTYD
jgi:enoyl-CoA hydratase/carnithine racemase